jgi:hypothetical protein
VSQEFHFICIDKREKGKDNKTYIVLENGQRIVMPENVMKVPALLLLSDNYRVLYGDHIYNYMKPKQEVAVKQATQNNLEPMAFSFGGGGGCGVASDQFSFLDMDAEDLTAKGNGGMRQMHNYVDLNTAFNGQISQHGNQEDFNTTIRGSKKMAENDSNQEMENRMKRMQEEREADMQRITGNRPPMNI